MTQGSETPTSWWRRVWSWIVSLFGPGRSPSHPADELEAIRRIFEGSGHGDAEVRDVVNKLKEILHTLEVSDDLMHNVILHAQGQPYRLPDDPAAKVQYGLILYWIQHPPDLVEEILAEHPDLALIWKALELLAPDPTVTQSEYQFLLQRIDEKQGVVAPEGEILGKSTYEQLDTKWLYAFFNYLLNLVPGFAPARFGTTPYSGTMTPGADGKVRIAVIGDWGTGDYEEAGLSYDPAKDVMSDIRKLKPPPDYIVHLGDVYYAGTDKRLPPGEEARNLLALWPETPPERSFTLNSNHEMYGGAYGYFDVALGVDPPATTPFSHQNGTSYFSLRFGDWVIVGLDAAYHDPSALYMEGSLGDKSKYPHQYEFLGQVTRGAKRVIVLTHQTAMDTPGKTPLRLLTDVCGVVTPDYWYWGHVHLGVVYTQSSVTGERGIAARCIGHSAVPFGDAYELKDAVGKTVAWYAHTPAGLASNPNVMKNGFALLTLTEAGITEEVYETGNKTPVWTGSG